MLQTPYTPTNGALSLCWGPRARGAPQWAVQLHHLLAPGKLTPKVQCSGRKMSKECLGGQGPPGGPRLAWRGQDGAGDSGAPSPKPRTQLPQRESPSILLQMHRPALGRGGWGAVQQPLVSVLLHVHTSFCTLLFAEIYLFIDGALDRGWQTCLVFPCVVMMVKYKTSCPLSSHSPYLPYLPPPAPGDP